MRFFKEQKSEIFSTSMSLIAYQEMVNDIPYLYVKDTNDGVEVEWKLNKGIYLIAKCKYTSEANQNWIEIIARVKHASSYRYMIVLWIILGGIWIVFQPTFATFQMFIFGLLVVFSLWSYAASNRGNLIKHLSPQDV